MLFFKVDQEEGHMNQETSRAIARLLCLGEGPQKIFKIKGPRLAKMHLPRFQLEKTR